MPFEQYHEPADELPEETRTFARICISLIEEAEAIDWYEQRLALEKDPEARAIMENAQQEEFKHFAMDLEFLIRRTPKWRETLERVISARNAAPIHSSARFSRIQRRYGVWTMGSAAGLAAAVDAGSLSVLTISGATVSQGLTTITFGWSC